MNINTTESTTNTDISTVSSRGDTPQSETSRLQSEVFKRSYRCLHRREKQPAPNSSDEQIIKFARQFIISWCMAGVDSQGQQDDSLNPWTDQFNISEMDSLVETAWKQSRSIFILKRKLQVVLWMCVQDRKPPHCRTGARLRGPEDKYLPVSIY